MSRARAWCRAAAVAGAAILPPALAAAQARNDPAPEPGTGVAARTAVHAKRFMAVTANPHATRAAVAIMRRGGSAADAAIAAQLVLNLVEPQSSGIGGGGFILYWTAAARRLDTYDGRETAPFAVSDDLFRRRGQSMRFFDAMRSGRSVGVPGLIAMLAKLHRRHGRLPWPVLFEPAIRLAEKGFRVSPRLHVLIARLPSLRTLPATRRYFFGADGRPLPVRHRLRNPDLARTFRKVATRGPAWFYRGPPARDIVTAVRRDPRGAGFLALGDFRRYRAIRRAPVCGRYRGYRICGMGPPSSGAIAVAQILGQLEGFDLAAVPPLSARAVHLIAESSRLAFADRNAYVADSDFVAVPVHGLLNPAYWRARARAIGFSRSPDPAPPGLPSGRRTTPRAAANAVDAPSTTHLSIVDADGNAISMTTSIEFGFGSQIMVGGFLLNNQLTDFSFAPRRFGNPVANRVQPGKRPRSSMSPTMVFDRVGRLVLVVGSPGGSRIIGYVAKTIVAVLDWKMDIQSAVALPHFVNRNGPTDLERGTAAAKLAAALQALGHKVRLGTLNSGLHGIQVTREGLIGGVDPRREGFALGE